MELLRVTDERAHLEGTDDGRQGVVYIVATRAVSRLGKPLLISYIVLAVVGVLAVVASVAWMRWG